MSSVSLLPRGIDFTRLAIARGLSGGFQANEISVVDSRWPATTSGLNIKAAVAASSISDATNAGPLAVMGAVANEFLEIVRPQTIIGKLTGLRKIPLNTIVPAQSAGATVAWAGEGKPVPITSEAFTTVVLSPLKISGAIVVTTELLKTATLDAETLLRNDLAAAVVSLSDKSFIDPTIAAVAGSSPASVTNGAVTVASGADLATDLKALLALFTGDLDKAVFITNPRTAASLGVRASVGLGSDLGARGGSLAGIPVIVSVNMPLGVVAIIDPGQVVFGDAGIDIAAATSATVEMVDNPADPGTAATVQVSLFQRGLVSLRATRFLNWAVSRSGVVATLTAVT